MKELKLIDWDLYLKIQEFSKPILCRGEVDKLTQKEILELNAHIAEAYILMKIINGTFIKTQEKFKFNLE